MSRRSPFTALSVVAALASLSIPRAQDAAWSRYRGPNGQGVAQGAQLPQRASELEAAWRVPLAKGHSSPVVRGDRIYLTRESSGGAKRDLVCLDLANGKELWSLSFDFVPQNQHRFNSFASSTPAVDASGVYVSWVSDRDLVAVAVGLDGALRWQKTIGRYAARHGYGNSVVVDGDVLLIANENEGEASALLGIDKQSGKQIWSVPRESTRNRGSYATPVILGGKGTGLARAALFSSTKHGLTALEPASGKILWEHDLGFSSRFCATPALAGDRILAFAGAGGGGKDCALVRAPRAGETTAQEIARPRRNLPYVPCAVTIGDRFFLVSDAGIASCMNAKTGETLRRTRLGASFFASPVSDGKTIYVPDREGALHSVEAADEFRGHAQLEIGAPSFATPAIVANALLVRTFDALVRLRGPEGSAAQDRAKAGEAAVVRDDELVTHARASARAEGAIDENWPCFLGSRRDSKSRETGIAKRWPASGPKLLWERARGESFACPVAHDGKLLHVHRRHQAEADMTVDCLDAETGRLLWRFAYPCSYTKDRYIQNGGQRSAPVIHEGRVYLHGVGGMMHCLDFATGKEIWKRDVGKEYDVGADYFGVVSSPLVYGDYLIQNLGGDKGHSVAAFELATGKLAWGTGPGWGQSCSSPTIGKVHGQDRIFVLAGGLSRPPTGGLLVVNPKNGKVDFRYPFRSRRFESVNGSPPLFNAAENWLFLSVSYGVGSAILELDAKGGFKESWRSRKVGLQFQNAVLDGKRIYCIDGNSRTGSFLCLEGPSGKTLYSEELIWEETIEQNGEKRTVDVSVAEGSLLMVDGALLCLGAFGHLLRIEPGETGMKVTERHWLIPSRQSWTPPVIHRGLLYICQNTKSSIGKRTQPRLLCYDLRK